MRKFLLLIFGFGTLHFIDAQTPNDVLNLLIQRNVITQVEADSLRADAALKQQEADSKKKSFAVNAGKAIQLAGYFQVRYQNLKQSGKKGGFDIRRARLTVKGNISPYFGYNFQPEFAGIASGAGGATTRLLDAFAEVKLASFFNLSIGQQKITLSRESQEADNKYDFIDRSQVVNALTSRSADVIGDHNGRDIGLVAYGGFLKKEDRALIEYWIGLFNGTGINLAENNTTKDVSARLLVHPIPGLDLGGSYYDGVGIFIPSLSENHLRKRVGVELHYELKGFSFQTEYLKGEDGIVTKYGYYLQAGYYILPKLQIVGKFDSFDPDKAKSKNQTYIYFGGINYTFNPTTRLQLGYNAKQKQGGGPNTNVGVAQFTIGF